jgi:aspartate/methionine/tyrosine aminotransferase
VNPEDCKLERFFARWEFDVKHVLGASDVDGYSLRELLDLADHQTTQAWHDLRLGYTESDGHPLLREAIAEQYDTATAQEILVCGGGAAEAIYLTARCLLGPGDHAVVVQPAYEALHRVTRSTGADLSSVWLDADRGWRLDLDQVVEAFTPSTRALFLNYPHNPTGALLPVDDFRALIEVADDRDIAVVSDEVYRYLEHDPLDRLPAAADLSDRAVSIGVMSKAYGLAGLRVGWITTRDRAVRRRLQSLKDYTSVCASAPSEILALAALRAREVVVGRCRRIVLDNLAHVSTFLDRWSDLLTWVPPRGGTVGFPQLSASLPVDVLVEDLARTESVLVLPGSVFDAKDNRLRIGLGRTDTPSALSRFDDYLTRTVR